MSLFELLRKLIDIPSVTGREREMARFLAARLSGSGFEVKSQPVDGERSNILAWVGSDPRVIFCTHLDTVPPHRVSSEDDSFIYGRGACDAKGPMAAMIEAAGRLRGSGVDEVGLLFVVGEETDSVGAREAEALGLRSEFVVVGEPTGNRLAVGHKGNLMLRLEAEGRSAHSAYPDLGSSAVDKLIDGLQGLRGLDLGTDPTLGDTLLNIGQIEGGSAPNVVPARASAEVCIRSGRPAAEVLARVKKAVEPEVRVLVRSQADPQKLLTVPGFETDVMPYGTDIPHLKGLGKPLLLGPGDGRDAHTDEEKVAKRQLQEAVGLYEKLARMLLVGKEGGAVG